MRILAPIGVADPYALGELIGRGFMSESERAERAPEKAAREGQGSLFERLRGLLGLGAGSVRDDIEDALEGADSNADFTPQERAILKNVLALHEVRVADVMVPRADILAVASDTPLSEVLALFRTAGHSRFPVFGETLDDPQGMIHIRDFVDFLASEPKFGLAPPNSPSPVRERTARRRNRHEHAAFRRRDPAAGAVRAALDARAGSAR